MTSLECRADFLFSARVLSLCGDKIWRETWSPGTSHSLCGVSRWTSDPLSPSPMCVDLRSVPPFIILCGAGVWTQDSCQPLHYTSRHVIDPFKTTVIHAGTQHPMWSSNHYQEKSLCPSFREVSEPETHTGQLLECKYQSFQKSSQPDMAEKAFNPITWQGAQRACTSLGV